MKHTLKTVEPFFSAVAAGEKTFEVRRNDRAYQRGDWLLLYDADACGCDDPYCSKRKTAMLKEVTYVFSGTPALRDLGGIVPGYVVLGMRDVDPSRGSEEDR